MWHEPKLLLSTLTKIYIPNLEECQILRVEFKYFEEYGVMLKVVKTNNMNQLDKENNILIYSYIINRRIEL